MRFLTWTILLLSTTLVHCKSESPSGYDQSRQDNVTRLTVDHSSWNALLQKHVTAKGDVNYAGFKKDQGELDDYLNMLAGNHPTDAWSRSEKMAYWINAYNAFTIQLILENYPLSSITNLDNGKVWDRKWIELGDQTYSLNNIENDILRPRFKDARIHFAVNCAAESCPPLLNKAYTAQNLEETLDRQARSFINNPAYNKLSKQSVTVSKIFDWYGEDFDNLIQYLNKYSKTTIASNASVSYQNYNWSLNKQ